MEIAGITIETLATIVLFACIAAAILYRAIAGFGNGSSSADVGFGDSDGDGGGDGGGD
jgi:hypothetical protein